ncbi:MAG: hypothetical protein ABL879_03930 [Devosia sp.]
MRIAALAIAFCAALVAAPVLGASAYTEIGEGTCQPVETYEDGAVDMRCEGYGGIEVFLNGGDAREDMDFGVRNEAFETFSAFNGVGDTVEWMLDDAGKPYAAAIRFLIDVDGRSAQALVVSKIGTGEEAGCVVGVVDAATEQANGIARGMGALAPLFDCETDQVFIVPGARELVQGFNGANR